MAKTKERQQFTLSISGVTLTAKLKQDISAALAGAALSKLHSAGLKKDLLVRGTEGLASGEVVIDAIEAGPSM